MGLNKWKTRESNAFATRRSAKQHSDGRHEVSPTRQLYTTLPMNRPHRARRPHGPPFPSPRSPVGRVHVPEQRIAA